MAYTDVPTVSVGDLYSASDFNTYLRDNFRAGIPDIFTTKGDLGVASGADTIERLAVGNNDEWLGCDTDETNEVGWGVPTGFWEWFTFGAFACSSLNDCDLPHLQSEHLIADVAGSFGIPDTGARLFLTSLSVRRNGAGAAAYSADDHVTLDKNGDTGELYLRARAFGDSVTSEWHTQTGLMISDNSNNVHMTYVYNIGFNVRVKIWGYA